MLPKKLELRFGVERSDGYRSVTWKVWSNKNDVYLAQREGPAWQKFSFHGSGNRCRHGFTSEYVKEQGMPLGLSDRPLTKWQRAPIPPVPLSGSVVAELVIPTDFLSRLPDSPGKRVLRIPAAPTGHATIVDVLFTYDAEELIRGATFDDHPLGLAGYAHLPNGENVAVIYRYAEYDNKELRSPSTAGGRTFLFSPDDPMNTGRPVRITFSPLDVFGSATTIFELGGYALD
jgi:hypothetical protein